MTRSLRQLATNLRRSAHDNSASFVAFKKRSVNGGHGMGPIRSGVSIVALVCCATAAYADPLTCTTTGYKSAAGLVAAVADNALTLTWDGERNQEIRLRFTINGGTPTIADLCMPA